MTHADAQPDQQRTSLAKAASRGFGIGQIEARKYIAEQTEEQLVDLHGRLSEDLSVSQALAEGRPVPYAEYIRELVAKGQVEDGPHVEAVYQAGFDIGFTAYLVESLSAVSAYVPESDNTPQITTAGESARVT